MLSSEVTASAADPVMPCPICGGTEFEPGPNGRLSATGRLPRCTGCWSLERHRSFNRLMLTIPPPVLAWRRALQFAPDGSIDRSWFATFEGSRYGGENSIDVQDVARPSGSYDFISLSHVMEFVPDDRRAFSELVRIGSECSIIHISFASSTNVGATAHWDQPQGIYGRFHDYGADVAEWLGAARHGLTMLIVRMSDPVTQLAEPFHFFCRQYSDGQTLRAACEAAVPGSVISLTH